MLFSTIEIIIWFLTFISLIQCITLTDSKMLKHLCFIGINPLWSWCMILVFKFFITVVLQCSVNSCCTAKWSSHTYIHTLFFSYYLPWFFSCITAFSLLKKEILRFLHLYSSGISAYSFGWVFFFCSVFVWFWYQKCCNADPIKRVWECSHLIYFSDESKKCFLISSLNI